MADSDFEEAPSIVPRVVIRKRKEGDPPSPKRVRVAPYRRNMWWFIMLNRPTHIPPVGYIDFRALKNTITRYMLQWGFWRTNQWGGLDDGWSCIGGFRKPKEADEKREILYREFGWIIPNEMTPEQLNYIFTLVNKCGYDARIEKRTAEDYMGVPFQQKLVYFR